MHTTAILPYLALFALGVFLIALYKNGNLSRLRAMRYSYEPGPGRIAAKSEPVLEKKASGAEESAPEEHHEDEHEEEHEERGGSRLLALGRVAFALLALGLVGGGIYWYLHAGVGKTLTASGDKCGDGNVQTMAVDTAWKPVNPGHPKEHCDFSFDSDNKIELKGPDDTFAPTLGAIGLTKKMWVTEVHAVAGKATVTYLLCPWGQGPKGKVWACGS